MAKVFEGHTHQMYYNNKMPVRESVTLYKKAFKLTDVERVRFLALPCHARPERENLRKIGFDETEHIDNTKAMYFKCAFSPKRYAYAGIEYDKVDFNDKKAGAKEILRQVKEYKRVGFDGMKMFEGHPNTRYMIGCPLDDEIFDPFYDFCEKEGFPIIMHLTNSPDMWDINKISAYWIGRGCYFDERFPSFDQMQEEIIRMLEKHPKLKFTLAHFGFLTFAPKQRVEKFISFENTMLDVTPGGENYFNILKDKEYWIPFIKKHIDRFTYGTDMYNTLYDNARCFEISVTRRPTLVRQFFETTKEYEYSGKKYCGIGLEQTELDKLYYDNLYNLLKEPNKVDYDYFIAKCDQVIKEFKADHLEHHNIWCMKNDFISMKEKGYIDYFKD